MKNILNSPYKVLEVDPRASSIVIKAAYQALMRQHHPDHNGNEKRAKEINAAYAILSDMKENHMMIQSVIKSAL